MCEWVSRQPFLFPCPSMQEEMWCAWEGTRVQGREPTVWEQERPCPQAGPSLVGSEAL